MSEILESRPEEENSIEKGKIIVRCLVCNKIIKVVEGMGVEGVSHGVCENPDCIKKLTNYIEDTN